MTSLIILQHFEKCNTIQPRTFPKDFLSKMISQDSSPSSQTAMSIPFSRLKHQGSLEEMAYFRTGAENRQDEPETLFYCLRIK